MFRLLVPLFTVIVTIGAVVVVFVELAFVVVIVVVVVVALVVIFEMFVVVELSVAEPVVTSIGCSPMFIVAAVEAVVVVAVVVEEAFIGCCCLSLLSNNELFDEPTLFSSLPPACAAVGEGISTRFCCCMLDGGICLLSAALFLDLAML